MLDCLVIGGGPAGLTAAIYLARFHLSVVVVDEGKSRAALIPKTRNHAGYPAGIAGTELLARMRDQAELYGAQIAPGRIDQLSLETGVFAAKMSGSRLQARSVLLATGIINRRPDMSDALHDEAVAVGALRYCPVCDGFEVTDQTIGVIGSGERGTNEALFLRSYSKQITLIAPTGRHDLADEQRKKLRDAAVEVVDGPVGRFDLDDRRLSVRIGGTGVRSTAYTRRLDPRSDQAWQLRSAPQRRRKAALQSTAISGLPFQVSMRRETLCWASTRSATPWVKAASRRRPSATILPTLDRSTGRRLEDVEPTTQRTPNWKN